MIELAATGAVWAGVLLLACAAVAALAAWRASDFINSTIWVGVAAACTACALVLARANVAALAVIVVGVAWTSLVVLAAMLVTNRVSKIEPAPWPAMAAAALLVIGVMFAVGGEPGPPLRQGRGAYEGSALLWPAALAFAACVGSLALLGYGERGVLKGGGREKA